MVKSIATTVFPSFENNFVFRTIFDKIPFCLQRRKILPPILPVIFSLFRIPPHAVQHTLSIGKYS